MPLRDKFKSSEFLHPSDLHLMHHCTSTHSYDDGPADDELKDLLDYLRVMVEEVFRIEFRNMLTHFSTSCHFV